MIEMGVVKSFVRMLRSDDDNLQSCAAYVLSRLVKHCVFGHLLMVVGLIASTQTICGLP